MDQYLQFYISTHFYSSYMEAKTETDITKNCRKAADM